VLQSSEAKEETQCDVRRDERQAVQHYVLRARLAVRRAVRKVLKAKEETQCAKF
jgi:hypothetical protein